MSSRAVARIRTTPEIFARVRYVTASCAEWVTRYSGGWLAAYDGFVAGFANSFVTRGVLFFLGLAFAGAVLEIPFSLYQSFKIEARYGFNRMSLGLFFGDWLKSTLLSLVLIAGLGALALALCRQAPGHGALVWLCSWGSAGATACPTDRACYSKPSTEAGGSEREVNALSERGVSMGADQKDASRRSTHSKRFQRNGPSERVVLFARCQQMDHAELAVRAHELGQEERHGSSYAREFAVRFGAVVQLAITTFTGADGGAERLTFARAVCSRRGPPL